MHNKQREKRINKEVKEEGKEMRKIGEGGEYACQTVWLDEVWVFWFAEILGFFFFVTCIDVPSVSREKEINTKILYFFYGNSLALFLACIA